MWRTSYEWFGRQSSIWNDVLQSVPSNYMFTWMKNIKSHYFQIKTISYIWTSAAMPLSFCFNSRINSFCRGRKTWYSKNEILNRRIAYIIYTYIIPIALVELVGRQTRHFNRQILKYTKNRVQNILIFFFRVERPLWDFIQKFETFVIVMSSVTFKNTK